MADVFTNDLRIREQESGSNAGTWGGLLNTTIRNIASAFGQGSETIPNASTHTITLADGVADEARSMYLKCTGGGQACTVTLAPNTISKVWIISNETSFTLTFTQGSGANVAVAAGAVKTIVTDGAGASGAVTDALSGLEGAFSSFATTGNAGIGGAAHASDALNITTTNQHIRLNNGSELGILALTSDGDLDFWAHGADEKINFRTGTGSGTVAMNVVGTNVGIGTSSPSYNFHVTGSGDTIAAVTAGASSVAGLNLGNDTNKADGGIRYDNSADALILRSGNAERVRITSAGAVGIGTSSPSSYGGNLAVSGTGSIINARSSSGTSAIGFWENASSRFFLATLNGSDGLAFIDGDGSTERMRITSAGLVGIGVSAPSRALEVSTDGTAQFRLSRVDSTINGGNTIGTIEFMGTDDTSGTVGATIAALANTTWGGGAYPCDLAFSTMAGSTLSERMRIDSSGTVSFHGISGRSTGSTGHLSISDQSNNRSFVETSTTTTSLVEMIAFLNPNGKVGKISMSGSATNYVTSSDYRLKENVVTLSRATDRLLQLKPSRFNFIADADTTLDGFLAHEVQDIVPEAVTGAKDAVDADGNPDYQGIDQSKLVPLLVATIQELEARLTALENN